MDLEQESAGFDPIFLVAFLQNADPIAGSKIELNHNSFDNCAGRKSSE